MLRNKEMKVFILIISLISIVGSGIVFFINPKIGIITFLIIILLDVSFIIFTMWRYREIKKLSNYLDKICLGDYTLDVRDNIEGELSILKNDIYKVTLMLSEQAELLKKDKVHLSDAISDISHQLKTPLTSMFVMTDLLSRDNLSNEKRLEFIRNIENQLERIKWLITSLLKLSKIDAGTVIFKKNEINVKDIVNKVVEPFLISIELKEQSLNIRGDDTVEFIGDFNWTLEAITNIVKNCLEHTPKGGEINISFIENPIYTEIVIKDNGNGIDKEDLPNIFKRFYKGKNAGEDSVGIGLAMAKTILKGQNGDVTVKSRKLVGTEFSIKFYKQIV